MANLFLLPLPNVMAMLGVGTYAAQRIVDALFIGAATWQIIGLIVTCGTSISFGLLMLKQLTKKVGKKAAITW